MALQFTTSRTNRPLSSKHLFEVVTDIINIFPKQQRQFAMQHDSNMEILKKTKKYLTAQKEHMEQLAAQLSVDRKGTLRDNSHSLELRKAALNESG